MRHFNLITGMLLAVSAVAQAETITARSKKRSVALAPDAKSIAISETPIEGILMVQVSGDVVYMTADGKFLIQGRVVNMDTREDLTETAKSEVRRELLDGMDTSKQITFSPRKSGIRIDGFYRHRLWLLPQACMPRCRNTTRMELRSITWLFHERVLVPVPTKKPFPSGAPADQQDAMTKPRWAVILILQQCENPIAEQYQLGMALGVTGTPALLTADGTVDPWLRAAGATA